MKRGLFPAFFAVALVAATAIAANDVRGRRMGIGRTATHLTASFRFTDLFTRRVREKVDDGFQTTILATLNVHRSGDEDASIGGTARTCLLSRDVWEEDYRAAIVGREGGERRHRVRTFEEVVRLCAEVDGLPVARLSAFRPGRNYRITARLDVNPLSRDSVRRIQRWLRNPEPTATGEGGSSIFGSVASIFVNQQVGRADRTLRLRSQAFTVP